MLLVAFVRIKNKCLSGGTLISDQDIFQTTAKPKTHNEKPIIGEIYQKIYPNIQLLRLYYSTANKGGDASNLKNVDITVNDTMKVLPSFILSAGTVTVLFCTVVTTTAAPADDEVTSYPGFSAPPILHYSGFLDVSDACDTKKNGLDCQLHYMLALAEVDDAAADDVDASRNDEVTTPMVVWFNGGPGC